VDTKLSKPMLGWDTGTVEILAPIVVESVEGSTVVGSKAQKLIIATTDSREITPANQATAQNGRLTWQLNSALRLPVYSRHASSLTFEIGTNALAVLWLKDMVDDEEADVRIPVVTAKDLKQLRQNVLTDFTEKSHEYQVVGYLSTRIKLDRGLDEVSTLDVIRKGCECG